jgi:hypothetical protein
MDRESIVASVAAQNGLPQTVAERCVGSDGAVDYDKVQIAKDSLAFGKSPAATADPKFINHLEDALREARAQGDIKMVITLRRKLSELGVHNPA